MRLWAYLQDNTVPGCGEAECCGEAYEELDWSFHLGVEPMTEEQLVEEHGGGPLIKVRQATKKEARGYWAGLEQGTQSGWGNGVEYERDLWRSRLERIRTWNPTSSADFHEGALTERMRIIDLIRDTYTDHDFEETGSFVYSEDIIELIEKGN